MQTSFAQRWMDATCKPATTRKDLTQLLFRERVGKHFVCRAFDDLEEALVALLPKPVPTGQVAPSA